MFRIGETERRLLKDALKAMNNAHVLWGLKVGAAVLAEDGKTYGGYNVESWISGLVLCAERCAINHAFLHGNRKIREVAMIINAENQFEPRPCGACLQYIYDFAEDSQIKIAMAKAEDGRIFLKLQT